MTTTERVYEHLKQLPESALHSVLDFVEFLEHKERQSGRGSGAPDEDDPWVGPAEAAPHQVRMAEEFDAPLEDFKDYQ